MSVDKMGSYIDEWPRLQDSPEYQKQLQERVQVVEKQQQYASTLTKANDVLMKLNLTDEEDDIIREDLLKLDRKTLENLSNKSKEDIEEFLFNKIDTETSKEKQKNDFKMEKIKSILTPEILANHTDITNLFKEYDNFDKGNSKYDSKKDIIDEITKTLQDNPWKLESIINSIGWVGSKSYEKFKNTLISADESFKPIFEKIEAKNIQEAIKSKTDEAIKEVEEDTAWNYKIDIENWTSNLRLNENWYYIKDNLDKEAINELTETTQEKLQNINESLGIVNEFWISFETLKNDIWKIWGEDNFNSKLNDLINSYSVEIFWKLEDSYKKLNIPSSLQIDDFEIESLKDINKPEDLRPKLENIEKKLDKISNYIVNLENETLTNYKQDLKELIDKEPKEKEKQLKILTFLDNSWFSMFPQELTDKIIKDIQSNTLVIPWINLSPKNINLANWNFWESEVFWNNENGLTNQAKINLVSFVNKMLSSNPNEPFNVEAIVNGVTIINPSDMRKELDKTELIDSTGWKYSKMTENLRKEPKIS